MKILTCIAATTLCVLSTHAYGWGQEGHSIVAEIAQRNLTGNAPKHISDLLGPNVSLASIASWADDQKTSSAYPGNSAWHYVNIPLGDATYDATTECKNDNCVIKQILLDESRISCEPDPVKRADYLKFLVHFVGDVHQPWHTVADYVGGNTIIVTMNFPGKLPGEKVFIPVAGVPLHVIWDTTLITRTVYDWGAMVGDIETTWIPKLADATSNLDPAAWALEAHAWVANSKVKSGDILDETYYDANEQIVEEQLGRAGLRLAAILNKYLDTAPACPIP